MKKVRKIGRIDINEEMVISDPCYDFVEYLGFHKNFDNGIYDISFEEKGNGKHIFVMRKENIILPSWKKIGVIGVDSGQICVFKKSQYRNDNYNFKNIPTNDEFKLIGGYIDDGDKWFETLSKYSIKYNEFIFEDGVVFYTPYGDGLYRTFVCIKENKIVGLRIHLY